MRASLVTAQRGRDEVSFRAHALALRGRDRALVLSSPQDGSLVADYDLERERTRATHRFTLSESGKTPACEQFAVLSNGSTSEVVGVGERTLFRAHLDSRTKRGAIPLALATRRTALSENAARLYRSAHFTHVAATEDGRVVAGDARGYVRLFTRLGENAKYTFRVGTRTLSLDVSPDGRWVAVVTPQGCTVLGPLERWGVQRRADVKHTQCCALNVEEAPESVRLTRDTLLMVAGRVMATYRLYGRHSLDSFARRALEDRRFYRCEVRRLPERVVAHQPAHEEGARKDVIAFKTALTHVDF